MVPGWRKNPKETPPKSSLQEQGQSEQLPVGEVGLGGDR